MVAPAEHFSVVGPLWYELEQALLDAGAEGETADERINSLRGRLSSRVISELHAVRIERNALIHDGKPLANLSRWEECCLNGISAINGRTQKRQAYPNKKESHQLAFPLAGALVVLIYLLAHGGNQVATPILSAPQEVAKMDQPVTNSPAAAPYSPPSDGGLPEIAEDSSPSEPMPPLMEESQGPIQQPEDQVPMAQTNASPDVSVQNALASDEYDQGCYLNVSSSGPVYYKPRSWSGDCMSFVTAKAREHGFTNITNHETGQVLRLEAGSEPPLPASEPSPPAPPPLIEYTPAIFPYGSNVSCPQVSIGNGMARCQ